MVKFCIDKYPMGSFNGQKSPGKYMDGFLYRNLENLADKIVNDMTFMGVIYSSTLEVGTGKSVLATQIGEAWSEIIKKKHGIDIAYNVDNIVWRPKELIEKAFKVPKYSYVLLDEWEDSTYWGELAMTLRQFFRKCRQLNLFIMCIIPNWFQLPLSYAVSRSVFAIDVKFDDNLNRGFFSFYNFPSKRFLYIMGKKTHNYKASRATFSGRFTDGYGVDEAEYRKRKYEDMLKYDEENPERKTKAELKAESGMEYMKGYLKKHPKATMKELSEVFGVSMSTITNWKRGNAMVTQLSPDKFNVNLINKEVFVDEEAMEKAEKERENVQEE
jgi:hypothetical protein